MTLLSQGFSPGCGGRTRTCDLRVMSPTSYQLLHSAVSVFLVLVAGLEPAWMGIPRILSPLRLPIPPHEQHVKRLVTLAREVEAVKAKS